MSKRAMTRVSLEIEARNHAREVLLDQRPDRRGFQPDDYWGAKCPDCGTLRPISQVFGEICECEREKGAELAEEYMATRRSEVAGAILDRAGIPPRCQRAEFSTFELEPGTEEALEAISAWAEGFTLETKEGIHLAGGWGSGKTHMAVAALRVAVRKSLVEARFVSAGGLAARVQSDSKGILWRPVEAAIRVGLLLVDDLGQESTDFARGLMSRVIIGRHEEMRPTLLTSNCGPERLADLYGGAVVSRICEMCRTIPVTAADYRRREVTT